MVVVLYNAVHNITYTNVLVEIEEYDLFSS